MNEGAAFFHVVTLNEADVADKARLAISVLVHGRDQGSVRAC